MAAPETKVKVGGAWKTLVGIQVKVAGVWKTVDTVESKVASAWELTFSSGPPNEVIDVTIGHIASKSSHVDGFTISPLMGARTPTTVGGATSRHLFKNVVLSQFQVQLVGLLGQDHFDEVDIVITDLSTVTLASSAASYAEAGGNSTWIWASQTWDWHGAVGLHRDVTFKFV